MELDGKLEIISFEDKYKTYFEELNTEWITKYFEMEENDIKSLNNPEDYIKVV